MYLPIRLCDLPQRNGMKPRLRFTLQLVEQHGYNKLVAGKRHELSYSVGDTPPSKRLHNIKKLVTRRGLDVGALRNLLDHTAFVRLPDLHRCNLANTIDFLRSRRAGRPRHVADALIVHHLAHGVDKVMRGLQTPLNLERQNFLLQQGSYRLWKKSLIRWNQNTDVPMWRRFEKLSKQLDWDLQGRFEHVPEATLSGAGYLDAVLNILDGLAGEKDASENRRVVRAALFEGQRKKEETLSQFAVRREQEFAGADRCLTIPAELKAFILEETAGLIRQGVQNLRTLTGGAGDFDRMVGAEKTLDVEEEPLTKGKSSLFAGMASGETGPEGEDSDPDDDGRGRGRGVPAENGELPGRD